MCFRVVSWDVLLAPPLVCPLHAVPMQRQHPRFHGVSMFEDLSLCIVGSGDAGSLSGADEVRIDVDSGSEMGSDAVTGVGTRVDDGRTTWGQPWDAVWIHPREVDPQLLPAPSSRPSLPGLPIRSTLLARRQPVTT